MYDETQVWLSIVQRFVDGNAFLDEGLNQVYIRDNGLYHIEENDPKVVLKLMNDFPHILEKVAVNWKTEVYTIQQAFIVALYEQCLEDDKTAALMQQAINSEEGAALLKHVANEIARVFQGKLQLQVATSDPEVQALLAEMANAFEVEQQG